ncbi:hypothetical protein [Roseovarius aquimarinus]|uniref:Uncharacterized protein n=1 Tax=Roseovarius aquimarinus TaxID=1229156 RepID=A0ABW7I473_9RHOB
MIEKTRTAELAPLIWGIARPTLAWTLHFIFVYAALSAACGERAVTGYSGAVIAIALATVAALVVAGWSLFRGDHTEFHIAARWTTVISIVAILFSASPVLLLGGCN